MVCPSTTGSASCASFGCPWPRLLPLPGYSRRVRVQGLHRLRERGRPDSGDGESLERGGLGGEPVEGRQDREVRVRGPSGPGPSRVRCALHDQERRERGGELLRAVRVPGQGRGCSREHRGDGRQAGPREDDDGELGATGRGDRRRHRQRHCVRARHARRAHVTRVPVTSAHRPARYPRRPARRSRRCAA